MWVWFKKHVCVCVCVYMDGYDVQAFAKGTFSKAKFLVDGRGDAFGCVEDCEAGVCIG